MILILIIIGFLAGSFLNNYISYLCGFSKFDFTRSTCFCNDRKLKSYELIPAISFIILKGKCKECKKNISSRYLIIEIVAALILIICYYNYSTFFYFFIYTVLAMSLLVAAAVDYYKFKIPNQIIILIILVYFAKITYENNFIHINLFPPFAVVFVLSVVDFIYYKLSGKMAIGFGDIKLLMSLSLFFNLPFSFLGIWVSSFIALPGYLILNTYNKERFSGNKVPFGIFISVAYFIMLICQRNILHLINLVGRY